MLYYNSYSFSCFIRPKWETLCCLSALCDIVISRAVRKCEETNKLEGISMFLACMLIANKALSIKHYHVTYSNFEWNEYMHKKINICT